MLGRKERANPQLHLAQHPQSADAVGGAAGVIRQQAEAAIPKLLHHGFRFSSYQRIETSEQALAPKLI